MNILDEYRGVIIIVCIAIVIGSAYIILTTEEVKPTYQLTIECSMRSNFSLMIKGSDGRVDYEGKVFVPFIIFLERDTYEIKTWYNEGNMVYGYTTNIELNGNMLLHALV